MLRGYHELRIIILCENGCEQVWLFGCGSELKERLCSSFYQRWRGHIEASNTFAVYREYKCVFESEKYVLVLRVEGYRNALAQFRMRVSPINMHRYRFSSIMEKKVCPICPDTPENEMHFLFA